MELKRRQFVKHLGVVAVFGSVSGQGLAHSLTGTAYPPESKPWIELSKAAYLHNASLINQMAGSRPVMAVLKNNAYGLGVVQVAEILNTSNSVLGMAVVKDESALAIRSAGVTKPVLLMNDFDTSLAQELIRQDITLSIYSRSSLKKIRQMVGSATDTVKVALYVDTGLGRMGIPYRETVRLAGEIANAPGLSIEQTFSTLTTPRDFAQEQIVRFEEVIKNLEKKGISPGLKHLAPSYSLLDLPGSHQEAVRPGILLHGSFPMADMPEAKQYPLKIPYRLKAPVIRLEKLKAGDTIGFSRFYKVKKDEWIATLPIGWADGYDSGAENGAKVLLGEELYPVVNVNASHTNVSLGEKTRVNVGDAATLIGPDRAEITPEGFGKLVNRHNYLQINYKESIPKRVYETF